MPMILLLCPLARSPQFERSHHKVPNVPDQ